MARSLRDILKKRVMKQVSRTAEAAGAARQIWDSVVPARYRGHAVARSYTRRVLEVAVDSAPVLAEIEGFCRGEIESALKERFTEAGMAPPVRVKYIIEERL
ncbi:MAG: DUF721 domain-containing protein [Planctomycetes bacterium]|nr:DUF721 domain-containing protein [Planctomycetota bacterium]